MKSIEIYNNNIFKLPTIIAELQKGYKLGDKVLTWFKEHPEEAFDSESKYSIKVYSNDEYLQLQQLIEN